MREVNQCWFQTNHKNSFLVCHGYLHLERVGQHASVYAGLVHLRDERRKDEGESENDREPDQPHGSWWRVAGGSLAER